MKIRVVANKPTSDQIYGSLDHLMGKEFEVVLYDKENDEVSIIDTTPESEGGFNGEIVLNKDEYKIVHD